MVFSQLTHLPVCHQLNPPKAEVPKNNGFTRHSRKIRIQWSNQCEKYHLSHLLSGASRQQSKGPEKSYIKDPCLTSFSPGSSNWVIIAIGKYYSGLPSWLSGKESICKERDAGDTGSIPGSGRSPGDRMTTHSDIREWVENVSENPMNRGAWWATVHGVTKSWTQMSMQVPLLLPVYRWENWGHARFDNPQRSHSYWTIVLRFQTSEADCKV